MSNFFENHLGRFLLFVMAVSFLKGYLSADHVPAFWNGLSAAIVSPAYIAVPALIFAGLFAAVASLFTQKRVFEWAFLAAGLAMLVWADFTIHPDVGCNGVLVERGRFGSMECWVP